jgi:hypothetical protein
MTVLPPDRPAGDPADQSRQADPDVGRFRRGSAISRIALGRYLVARAVGEAVNRSMLLVGVVLGLLGIACFAFWLKWLGVLIFIAALVVLAFRALFVALLRRLAGPLGVAEERIRALVADSRGDLCRELKRIGLPGSTLGLPLLGVRLIGRHRTETLARLRQFDVGRVVPASRLDQLHLIIENDVLGRGRQI